MGAKLVYRPDSILILPPRRHCVTSLSLSLSLIEESQPERSS